MGNTIVKRTTLIVRDIKKSRAWYEQVLEMSAYYDDEVVLSGTGTVREHVQRLGRILRPGEGKQAVLYEIVAAATAEMKTSQRRRRHDAYR